MEHLQLFAASQVYAFVLVLARTGTALMLLPGFGETSIPQRIRLVIALAVSLAVLPLAPVGGVAVPVDAGTLAGAIGAEFMAGAFLGASSRILFSMLHMAGQIIGQSMGLSALVGSPGAGFDGGGAPTANLLVMAGIVAIFVTNTHVLMIEAMIGSYRLMPLGALPAFEDMASEMARITGRSFLLAVQFSSPFLVLAFLFNLGLGLTNRMMQAMPVFFIGMPFMLAGGLVLLSMTAGSILSAFLAPMAAWLGNFAG